MSITEYLKQSEEVIAAARTQDCSAEVDAAIDTMCEALRAKKPLLVCGNGGSASDAMHIAGELVGRFLEERRALHCICLSSNPSVLTAWSNDYSYDTVFSRQVEAYAAPGGVVFGLSTSGNSKNVVEAFNVARSLGMKTIGLTGEGGGKMAQCSDILIGVPSRSTPMIQQVHICIYHYICQMVEARLLDD